MSMYLHTPSGDEIRYTGKGGSAEERSKASEVLEVGKLYTVGYVNAGSWKSDVAVEGIDGTWNTCLFDNRLEADFSDLGAAVKILKEIRLERGFVLRKFAEEIGVLPSEYSDLESGSENARFSVFAKACCRLDISVRFTEE